MEIGKFFNFQSKITFKSIIKYVRSQLENWHLITATSSDIEFNLNS